MESPGAPNPSLVLICQVESLRSDLSALNDTAIEIASRHRGKSSDYEVRALACAVLEMTDRVIDLTRSIQG